ncbi:hypothetical protein [Agromyces sp. NPDC058126]
MTTTQTVPERLVSVYCGICESETGAVPVSQQKTAVAAHIAQYHQ